jgi:hypothetical protein
VGWTWHRGLLFQSEDHSEVIDSLLRATPKWPEQQRLHPTAARRQLWLTQEIVRGRRG